MDYKKFYNEAINTNVQLTKHIELWLQEREKARKQNKPYDRYETFTICSFPWILDAASKSEMMRLEMKSFQRSNQN